MLVFICPFSNVHAENLLSENKFTESSDANFKFLNETRPNLKILDLNTMLIPFEFIAPANMERAQELKNFILKDYDVVLLQEVFSKKMQRDFIEKWYFVNDMGKLDKSAAYGTQVYDEEILNQRPNDIKVNAGSGIFFVSGPKRQGLESLFGSGLLLLSKYPIIYSNVFCYTDRAGTDVFASKGAIYAKIKTGEGPNEYIHFFTTHLQSHDYINSRQKNIEELFSFVSKIISDEINKTQTINPVIITGDFNVPANSGNKEISSEYNFLTENINSMCAGINSIFPNGSFYLKDLWAEKNPGNAGYTWIAKNEEEIKNSPYGELGNTIAIEKQGAGRIDYIFYFEGSSNSIKTESLNINLVPKKPEKMYSFKNGKLKSYTLSDHLGLDAEFKIIK
ncbi:MAG: endonuclease/exonuclease/phosphatase family protein [Candidatus Humimicrobiaceae bacterium]